MTVSAEKIVDLRTKHLEMLQSLIARTACHGESFKIADPSPGYMTPLSQNATVYDDYIADDGHKNIGSWIDMAAKQLGR